MSLLQTRLKWQKLVRVERSIELRAALLASFTAQPIAPYLGVALHEFNLSADVWIGPYNQIVQECLSDESETARYAPHVLIAWPRLEDLWGGRPLPLAEEPAAYIDEAIELAEACLDAARRWRSTLLFVLPAIPEARPLGVGDAGLVTGVFATATAVREALRRRLAGQRGVLLFDLEEAVRQLGVRAAHDARLLTLARVPYTEELFHAAGERMARLIDLSRRPARKVVVVDADGTLWGGVVGEDGPAGIDLSDNGPGEAYRAFQSFLLELRRAGVLLAVCSKNDEADVWAAFDRREMRLKREHLAAWRINWQPKSINLREIADELNLGIDSLVLIDDSPAEIAEVQVSLPGVACIQMPDDPVHWLSAVQASGVLDRLPPTAEDLQRAAHYAQEQLRRSEQDRAASPREYLAQLDVQVRVFTPASTDMPRLAQLIAKTNQFNLNCRRRSEAELVQLAADDRYRVRLAQARDRFGDYGVVGAFILKVDDGRADIDTFLLSCRAMGRGVEEAMLAEVFKEAGDASALDVFAAITEAPRNEPARRFFGALGCEVADVESRLSRIEWPVHVARLS